MDVSKNPGPFVGVLTIRILVFGCLFLETPTWYVPGP